MSEGTPSSEPQIPAQPGTPEDGMFDADAADAASRVLGDAPATTEAPVFGPRDDQLFQQAAQRGQEITAVNAAFGDLADPDRDPNMPQEDMEKLLELLQEQGRDGAAAEDPQPPHDQPGGPQ